MKSFVVRSVVVLAVLTSFTVTAEAKPVQNEAVSISVASSVSAVGVLSAK